MYYRYLESRISLIILNISLKIEMSYVPYRADDCNSSGQENDSQIRQYQLLEKLQERVHKLPM